MSEWSEYLPAYGVTPDGKLGIYYGDQLVDAHEVPEPWEFEAEQARLCGDEDEVIRIIDEQYKKLLDKLSIHLRDNLG